MNRRPGQRRYRTALRGVAFLVVVLLGVLPGCAAVLWFGSELVLWLRGGDPDWAWAWGQVWPVAAFSAVVIVALLPVFVVEHLVAAWGGRNWWRAQRARARRRTYLRGPGRVPASPMRDVAVLADLGDAGRARLHASLCRAPRPLRARHVLVRAALATWVIARTVLVAGLVGVAMTAAVLITEWEFWVLLGFDLGALTVVVLGVGLAASLALGVVLAVRSIRAMGAAQTSPPDPLLLIGRVVKVETDTFGLDADAAGLAMWLLLAGRYQRRVEVRVRWAAQLHADRTTSSCAQWRGSQVLQATRRGARSVLPDEHVAVVCRDDDGGWIRVGGLVLVGRVRQLAAAQGRGPRGRPAVVVRQLRRRFAPGDASADSHLLREPSV